MTSTSHHPSPPERSGGSAPGLGRRPAGHRPPYVGAGADGARRSADIDRSEADCMTTGSARWDELQASASRWDAQAADLEQDHHLGGLAAEEAPSHPGTTSRRTSNS